MAGKHKVALLASVLLWPLLAWALAVSFTLLPTNDPAHFGSQPADWGDSWLDHGPAEAGINGLALLFAIYGVKFLIGHVTVRASIR